MSKSRWLIVLDDLQDPAHLDGLWPPTTPTGQVVVTTRLADSALARRGHLVTVGQFTPAEAAAYLSSAFADHPARAVGAAEAGSGGHAPQNARCRFE